MSPEGRGAQGLDTLGDDKVTIKLTIPEVSDLYKPVEDHPRTLRIVALSGGYELHNVCRRLSRNRGMIASFSRALVGDLKLQMSDAEFNARQDARCAPWLPHGCQGRPREG